MPMYRSIIKVWIGILCVLPIAASPLNASAGLYGDKESPPKIDRKPGKALVKSYMGDDRQEITVCFTNSLNCDSVAKEYAKEMDLEEEFEHDNKYRHVTYKVLDQIIDESIGSKSKSKVSVTFHNISDKPQLELLSKYYKYFNSIRTEIEDYDRPRIIRFDAEYYYFNDERSPFSKFSVGRYIGKSGDDGWSTPYYRKPKNDFEAEVRKFLNIGTRDTNAGHREKEHQDFREWERRQFVKNNYPKPNVRKGADSSSSDSEDSDF